MTGFEAWKATQYKPGRWYEAAVFVGLGHPCEGVSASWCPNCGDCICDREHGLDHPNCPLHASDSPHATGKTDD